MKFVELNVNCPCCSLIFVLRCQCLIFFDNVELCYDGPLLFIFCFVLAVHVESLSFFVNQFCFTILLRLFNLLSL